MRFPARCEKISWRQSIRLLWSSRAAAIRGPDSPLLKSHPPLLTLGPDWASRRAACRPLVDRVLDTEAVGTIRETMNGNYILRIEQFRQ